MAHTLIVGITGAGKTTLAVQIARAYKEKNIPVLVLDVFINPRWDADYITDNPAEFLDVVFKNRSCAIFVDESGDNIGRYAGTMAALATRARRYGHNSHFIAQRAKQIDPTVRAQCENIILFKQSLNDTKELANEFVDDALMNAHTLKAGEYLAKIGIDGETVKSNIFLQK